MMKNCHESVKINHNPNLYNYNNWWSRISETNVLPKVMKSQRPDTDKICLYIKDPFESRYQMLNKGGKIVRIK